MNIDFDTIFRNTNTSYNPDEDGRSSGTSGADVERILAFHAIGREDPVEYVTSWNEVLQGEKAQLRFSCNETKWYREAIYWRI